MLSNAITEGEKKDLESKILELEAHKSSICNQVEDLETENNSLEKQIKVDNEKQLERVVRGHRTCANSSNFDWSQFSFSRTHAPKTTEGLKMESTLLNFSSKATVRLNTTNQNTV